MPQAEQYIFGIPFVGKLLWLLITNGLLRRDVPAMCRDAIGIVECSPSRNIGQPKVYCLAYTNNEPDHGAKQLYCLQVVLSH